jgi:hypothetical protein
VGIFPHHLLLLPKHLEQLWHGMFGSATPVCDRLYQWSDPKFLEQWHSAKGELTLFSHSINKKNNELEGSIVFKQNDFGPVQWVRYARMYGSTNLPLGHFLLCRKVHLLGLSRVQNAVRWEAIPRISNWSKRMVEADSFRNCCRVGYPGCCPRLRRPSQPKPVCGLLAFRRRAVPKTPPTRQRL